VIAKTIRKVLTTGTEKCIMETIVENLARRDATRPKPPQLIVPGDVLWRGGWIVGAFLKQSLTQTM
jgi:hypothetical protein